MAAMFTLEDEDARRPGRERETLVGERTRIVNRLKANLARLGIRGFQPNLARAQSQLEALRTPEGAAIPTNTLAEMQRDMDRLRLVSPLLPQRRPVNLKERMSAPATSKRQVCPKLDGMSGDDLHGTVKILVRLPNAKLSHI